MGLWSSFKNISPKAEIGNDVPVWSGQHFDFSSWNSLGFYGGHDEILSTNEAIFSIVTRLANAVSGLPIQEYKQFEEANSNLIDLLTTEANPSLSGFDCINETEVARDISGNGYIFIQRDQATGTPIALWPLNPNFVTILRNVDDNSIWYRVSSDEFNFTVYNTEIIHVKHIHPLGGIAGISPLDVLKNSIKFQKAVQDFSLNEMDKKDQYIIKYDRSMDEKRRQALINDFVRMIKDNGGAVVQEAGFDIERYQSTFNPADLSSVESISRNRIANAFNVPLSFLNDGSSSQTTDVEHIMTEFVEMTLLPIVRQYESEFNRKLLTQSQRAAGYYFKFNVNGLMRGDTAARTQFYQMMVRNGIATPNELRKLEDLPVAKEPNADKLWFSKDLALLDQADKVNAPATADTQSKGGDTGGENEDSNISNGQTGSTNSNDRRHVY